MVSWWPADEPPPPKRGRWLKPEFFAVLSTAVFLSLSAASAGPPTADDLFDPEFLQDIQLSMKPADWDRLRAAYLEDTYYPADVRWRDQEATTAGVRSRGFGSRNAHKPGLRIDFGRYASRKSFLGLKSLVLANAIQDPSMLKQRAGMAMFNRMGMPAPRVVHARLFVNGQYVGLYELIESVDKAFLGRVFGPDQNGKVENDGHLYDYNYKGGWGFEYLGPGLEAYAEIFSPQTNESDAPSVLYGPLEEMFRAINQAPDEDFASAVGEFLELTRFARYLAIENFLADRDSVLGYWGANNFYLYRFEGRRDSQFIPWDKDLAFWAVDYHIFQGVEENVLARRMLAVPAIRRAYLDALLECAAVAMHQVSADSGTGWLEAEMRKEIAQFHDAAVADVNKRFTNERLDDELDKALRFAAERGPFVAREAQKELERLGESGR